MDAKANFPGQHAYFELTRAIDGLVYQFDRRQLPDGSFGYRRRDLNVQIIRKQEFGWISYDEATQSITGRPWNILPKAQGDHPPEGEWVSKKGSKSYVYTLAYREPRDVVPPRVIPDGQ